MKCLAKNRQWLFAFANGTRIQTLLDCGEWTDVTESTTLDIFKQEREFRNKPPAPREWWAVLVDGKAWSAPLANRSEIGSVCAPWADKNHKCEIVHLQELPK